MLSGCYEGLKELSWSKQTQTHCMNTNADQILRFNYEWSCCEWLKELSCSLSNSKQTRYKRWWCTILLIVNGVVSDARARTESSWSQSSERVHSCRFAISLDLHHRLTNEGGTGKRKSLSSQSSGKTIPDDHTHTPHVHFMQQVTHN